MFKLAIVYESGKRYILPFEIIEKHLSDESIERIKTEVLKELTKL